MTTTIEPVTIDLIKRLRSKHQYAEAKELLQAFRTMCDRQKEQDRHEYEERRRAIRATIGICSTNKCHNTTTTYRTCDTCRERKRNYKRQLAARHAAASST
jgi:hypothetical protein